MKKDEIQGRIQSIGTCEDQAQARTMLADLQKELIADYESHEKTASERDTFKNDNESLREANMKLFLQVGGKDVETKDPTQKTEDLKYEDLFDDKGGLK